MATSGRTAAGQPYLKEGGRPAHQNSPGRADPPLSPSPLKVGRSRRERRRKRRERAAQEKPERLASSLPFTPLSPVPPEVEPYLSRTRRAVTIHADGDKWADRGGSALPF